MKNIADIFKAYDIRGIYGKQLDEEIVKKIAQFFGELLKKENPHKTLTLAVAQDMRLSSPSLTKSVIAGLVERGINVVDVGLVSTPAFYFSVAEFNYDGGLMISASHNPKEYNGLKLVRHSALPVSGNTGIKQIRDQIVQGIILPHHQQPGRVITRSDIVKKHVQSAIQFSSLENIKPFKIVIDAANSMGATYFNELFKELPCQVIKMNFELDGSFPNHEADPFKEQNNLSLMKRIKQEKADLGIATDGDGDRIFYFDNEGKLIDQSIIRGLLAQIFLKTNPGAAICYDLRPGKITKDMIEAAGGKPVVTRVGHSLIKEQALKTGAVFAGESSGHFFVKTPIGFFEAPVIVTLKLLQQWSVSDQTIADQVRPLRKYYQSGEINSDVEDKAGVMAKILKKYQAEAQTVSQLDGITLEYSDFWFNVRASNTEAKLRLNLEAKTPELCQEKTQELLALIRA
ncbi:MAG: hypothetical protein A2233_01905 [Candidatus Kerfeldbacteria bacterium RIFOXYA2_FULL_38_24]|uniref:Phosphomannomutase/phosphoglucomutase n=1 Tax=Candidatus Kerfeldbacteria bacterium RIFOXYB2_FULL_38_14 TaxID=1798547 RepID=A0A1G2BHB4_9BACT|nr:MAG: hypothetical protein A2319_04510 [Candidatus Kerfeldbacteria bacterium RIFOXYB2_FULL_38_14]OGY87869.1 MAG: hypothetical protein A2233_01905 [Candidatus Kerfeldbacteria bacterium RIFOXYA2_FULL_38_24]OGY90016.1 MAG: hypothetical protein A2458_00030 [Candidatus Kerfeldbacteria bacterium RIFOXYC2_FULL_38_9]